MFLDKGSQGEFCAVRVQQAGVYFGKPLLIRGLFGGRAVKIVPSNNIFHHLGTGGIFVYFLLFLFHSFPLITVN